MNGFLTSIQHEVLVSRENGGIILSGNGACGYSHVLATDIINSRAKEDVEKFSVGNIVDSPDVFILGSTESIKVDDVEQLLMNISLSPANATKKVIIVENAALLSVVCQNKILKAVEDCSDCIFVFVCDKKICLLDTIRSRSIIVSVNEEYDAAYFESESKRLGVVTSFLKEFCDGSSHMLKSFSDDAIKEAFLCVVAFSKKSASDLLKGSSCLDEKDNYFVKYGKACTKALYRVLRYSVLSDLNKKAEKMGAELQRVDMLLELYSMLLDEKVDVNDYSKNSFFNIIKKLCDYCILK